MNGWMDKERKLERRLMMGGGGDMGERGVWGDGLIAMGWIVRYVRGIGLGMNEACE